jgi:cobalt-zinc-cadmium efflux system membrane fusion protein
MYYVVNRGDTSLAPGQRVYVEVPLSKNGTVQKVIPYAALIYDVEGGTWVYVKEANALTFIRQSVTVDYIQGDLAYLTDGPDVGSEVVTVGGAELFGVETGVSK